jgi:predicted AAA+ superfamily ATPase
MLTRLCNPLITNSFLLFGARGTGKSTLVKALLASLDPLIINLLESTQIESALFALPELEARIEAAVESGRWVFIDEVQKAPRLLDIAQRLIDDKRARFAISGSSARKLRRGGGNLLAGRAYSFQLFPLTSVELADHFDLDTHLAFGGLPTIWNITDQRERALYLRSYVTTYLKEEISEEQVVRKIEPFSRFLQVAAQSSGMIVNYSKISRDVGVSDQTVKTFFQILEDTLLGMILPPYHRSIRKAQGQSPKFYLFDTGVVRTLNRQIDRPLSDETYNYGALFEHFVIHEITRRSIYAERDWAFSFIRTADDQELDLVIDRPGMKTLAVEITSTKFIRSEHTEVAARLGKDIPDSEIVVLSRDTEPKQYGSVRCMHWREGIRQMFEA